MKYTQPLHWCDFSICDLMCLCRVFFLEFMDLVYFVATDVVSAAEVEIADIPFNS